MKSMSLVFAGAACVAGVFAAIYWWRSALIDQSFKPEPPIGDVAKDPTIIAGYLNDIYWQLFKFADTSKEVSRLNRKAAAWTAVSVLLSGLSSICGSWLSN